MNPAVPPGQHVGRTWSGTRIEDTCPCPKEPCGLVNLDRTHPDCTEHPPRRAKSMRQIHDADRCPAATRPDQHLPRSIEVGHPSLDLPAAVLYRHARIDTEVERSHRCRCGEWAGVTSAAHASHVAQQLAIAGLLRIPAENGMCGDICRWAGYVNVCDLPADHAGDHQMGETTQWSYGRLPIDNPEEDRRRP